MELAFAISCALAFALTNGFHDAANAIATLVATRGARPGQAIVLSATFNMLGALLIGTAVADTIAGIAEPAAADAVAVVGAGVLSAAVWNLLTWWRGLPSSSGHALVGGLVGSALATSGSDAVNWGGLSGWKPVGVLGSLIALAVSPVLGLVFGFLAARLNARVLARASRRVRRPIRGGQWGMSAALSFSHGANDAQKSMGVIAALLLASGHVHSLSVPLWVKLACGATLTLGTAMGGWRIVRTIGRRIFHLEPIDGLASQTASTAVILAASYAGAPVSTTQVVASSVVGVGARAAPDPAHPLGRRAVHGLRVALHPPRHGPPRRGHGARLAGDRMTRRRWFLPQSEDVVGMLRGQTEVTVEGMDAFAAWAEGDEGAADRVRACEHEADTHKRELRRALTEAFTTPLDPEDIFELSRGLDEVMNSAKNAVREAEVMGTAPDPAIAEMARSLAEGTRHLADAFTTIERDGDDGRRTPPTAR